MRIALLDRRATKQTQTRGKKMTLLSKQELSSLYSSKTVETTEFQNVKLLSKTWPAYLDDYEHKVNQGFMERGRGADRESYEEAEQRAAQDNGESEFVHELMLILRDPSGSYLLDGYDLYPYYASLVASGRMAFGWGMMTIRCERVLSVGQRFQLALYASMKHVLKEKHSDEVNTLLILSALRHVVVSDEFQYTQNKRTKKTVRRMRYLLESIGVELILVGEISLIKTAMSLVDNNVFVEFLLTYKDEFEEPKGEMFKGSDLFGPVLMSNFTYLYYEKWWCNESVGTQFMITIFMLGFYSNRICCEIEKSEPVFKQFLRILRACVQMTSNACRRIKHVTVEKALLACFQPAGAQEGGVRSMSYRQAEKLQDTFLYKLMTAILEHMYSSIESKFVPGFDENGYEIQDVLPFETKLNSKEFEKLWKNCLEATAQKLKESGLLHIREMVQIAEMYNP